MDKERERGVPWEVKSPDGWGWDRAPRLVGTFHMLPEEEALEKTARRLTKLRVDGDLRLMIIPAELAVLDRWRQMTGESPQVGSAHTHPSTLPPSHPPSLHHSSLSPSLPPSQCLLPAGQVLGAMAKLSDLPFETNDWHLPIPKELPCWLAALVAAAATPMVELGAFPAS